MTLTIATWFSRRWSSRYRTIARKGRSPDLIFATGDVAFSGKAEEYNLATKFFEDLLDAAKLEKRLLFVIPGNHDVDRDMGIGLARTFSSGAEADKYFAPGLPKPHLTQKMGGFVAWYNEFFKGIRAFPQNSTCGPVELAEVQGHKLAILPINSALFCQDDEDHNKLFVGRRCLDAALDELGRLGGDFEHRPHAPSAGMAERLGAVKHQDRLAICGAVRPAWTPA